MPHLLTLHVFAADFPGNESRALLDWCLGHGADTFTVSVIGTPPGMDAFASSFETRLAPFEVATDRVLAIPDGQPGAYWTRPDPLWTLTPESAEILWTTLSRGLLDYYPTADAWLENPILYRGPDVLLGVISHESEGVLRIRPEEQVDLDIAGVPYRLKGEWAGY
jgi:hypothetical protein